MFKFTNLTPHVLNIILASGEVMEVPPSGKVARVSVEYVEKPGLSVGEVVRPFQAEIVQTFKAVYGDVDRSLFETDDPNEVFIVSGMVLAALPDSWTPQNLICAPGELVRDADGKVIGCQGLKVL